MLSFINLFLFGLNNKAKPSPACPGTLSHQQKTLGERVPAGG
jgi:hypothetical protein